MLLLAADSDFSRGLLQSPCACLLPVCCPPVACHSPCRRGSKQTDRLRLYLPHPRPRASPLSHMHSLAPSSIIHVPCSLTLTLLGREERGEGRGEKGGDRLTGGSPTVSSSNPSRANGGRGQPSTTMWLMQGTKGRMGEQPKKPHIVVLDSSTNAGTQGQARMPGGGKVGGATLSHRIASHASHHVVGALADDS